jgi:DNA transformation protein
MKQSNFAEYVIHDLLGNIAGISARAMFGGHGLYLDGVIFGIIADDQIFFKTDKITQAKYEALGSKPFTYAVGKTKSVSMSYWELPAEIMDDPNELRKWILESYKISKSKKIK